MTDERYLDLRRSYREHGELASELLDELRAVAVRFVRFGGLPRSHAPYGVWDDGAAEEILAGWIEKRLIGRGHLLSILNQAAGVASFRRLSERSLRQYLLNERERTQSQNLYWRLKELLETDPDFALVQDATRSQDRWWMLAGRPGPSFDGDDRALLANAWALGDFTVIRYSLGAKKLAPVLDHVELKRFVVELLERLGQVLSLGLLIRVLSARFGLDEVRLETLPDYEVAATEIEIEPILRAEVAIAVVAEMTLRQVEILLGSAEDGTIEAMAGRLHCSQGTVINEQRRIGAIVSRFTENEEERNDVLRKVVDLLYQRQEEDS